jgi:hypothetical protein
VRRFGEVWVRSAARARQARAGCDRARAARSRRIAVGAPLCARVGSVGATGKRGRYRGPFRVRQGGAAVGGLLGLKCLQRAQRARTRPSPRRGSGWSERTDHQGRCWLRPTRLERPRPVAVADQGEPGPATRDMALLKQVGLNAVRPGQPPGCDRDPPREQSLERPPGPAPRPAPPRGRRPRQRPLVAAGRVSAPACRASARSAPSPPSRFFGPRDLAPCFRLASARALLIGMAARGDCPVGLGVAGLVGHGAQPLSVQRRGPNPTPRGQSCTGHGGIPCWVVKSGVRARGCGRPRATHYID